MRRRHHCRATGALGARDDTERLLFFGKLLLNFGGGLLMGWGSLLIPGSNDGLILIGMPLLWPYAWVAFAVMCLTIAAALRALRPRAPVAS